MSKNIVVFPNAYRRKALIMRCKVNKKLSETTSLGMIYFNGPVSLLATPHVRVRQNTAFGSLAQAGSRYLTGMFFSRFDCPKEWLQPNRISAIR